MDYLDFQGPVSGVDYDGEGITIRLRPHADRALAEQEPILVLQIERPAEAEAIVARLTALASDKEIERIGLDSGTEVEISFFGSEEILNIRGQGVKILNTALEEGDYEAMIKSLRANLVDRDEAIIALNDLVTSAAHLIEELERRWDIKLQNHDLTNNEDKLHADFVKSLERIKHRLSASLDKDSASRAPSREGGLDNGYF